MPGERAAREQQVVGPAAAAVLLVRRLRRALDEHRRALGRLAHGRGEAAGALDLVRARAAATCSNLSISIHARRSSAASAGARKIRTVTVRSSAPGFSARSAPQERLVVAVLDAVGLGHQRLQLVDRRAGVGLEARARRPLSATSGASSNANGSACSWSAKLASSMWRCQRQKNGSRIAVAVSPMSPGSPPPLRRHHERGDDVAVAVVPDVAPQRPGGRLLERAQQLRGQRHRAGAVLRPRRR